MSGYLLGCLAKAFTMTALAMELQLVLSVKILYTYSVLVVWK